MFKIIISLSFIFLFNVSQILANENSNQLNSISDSTYNDIVEIVIRGTVKDLKKYIVANKISNEDGRIAAQVALLLNKNGMLEILLRKDFFPCEEPLLSKENVIKLEEINLQTVKREINDVRDAWADSGVEGDCASMDPNSIIFSADSEQFEMILQHNKWMCGEKILMCGATTYQLISSEEKKKNAYKNVCGR